VPRQVKNMMNVRGEEARAAASAQRRVAHEMKHVHVYRWNRNRKFRVLG
jgi:hypothetical protein